MGVIYSSFGGMMNLKIPKYFLIDIELNQKK